MHSTAVLPPKVSALKEHLGYPTTDTTILPPLSPLLYTVPRLVSDQNDNFVTLCTLTHTTVGHSVLVGGSSRNQ